MRHQADTRHGTETAVPTIGRALARTLPACAVALVGIPLATWALPAGAGDRTPWGLLIPLGALVVVGVVHRLTRAPRPRRDKTVDAAQRRAALGAAAKSGTVPADPAVRRAAGVAACTTIELFAMMVAFLLGTLAGGSIRPDLDGWAAALGSALGGVIVYVFLLRSSWSYLHVLHNPPRAG